MEHGGELWRPALPTARCGQLFGLESDSGNEGLQETNRDIGEREATLHCPRCEELSVALTQLRLQRENDNRKITELENQGESAKRHIEELENQRESAIRRIEELRAEAEYQQEYLKRSERVVVAYDNVIEQRNRRVRELESALFAEREYRQEYMQRAQNLAAPYDSRIERLQEDHQQGNRHRRELETTLTQRCEKHLMVSTEQRLEMRSTNRNTWGLQVTLHQRHEELYTVRTEERLERGSSNRQIHELENKDRGAECYSQKVEAAPHGRIKELNEKVKDTNSDRKEVKSSRCGKVKKLAAVSVAVGLVVAAGWWFLSSHRVNNG